VLILPINSTYVGDDEKYYERSFGFTISEERKQKYNRLSGKTQSGTTVILDGFQPKYKKICPKKIETLARNNDLNRLKSKNVVYNKYGDE
jgi:hypothetical protein